MKKAKIEKIFFEELERVSNISVACKSAGLSRQSVYRWMREDEKFNEKVEEALKLGIESMCDLAESKLLVNVNSGNQRAIEFILINNRKQYYRPKQPMPVEKMRQVNTIAFEVVGRDGKVMNLADIGKEDHEEDLRLRRTTEDLGGPDLVE